MAISFFRYLITPKSGPKHETKEEHWSSIAMQLTQEQELAINTTSDLAGVVAGAGTGKTTVLVARVAKLLADGVPPENIWVFTFTRAAGQELVNRLGENGHRLHVGTFHSVAAQELGDVEVIDEDQSWSLLREAWMQMGCPTKRLSIGQWKKHTDDCRCIESGIKHPGLKPKQDLVAIYEGMLAIRGQKDYLGLLLWFYRHLLSGDYSDHHVLVDEAQDLDFVQWAIVDAMTMGHGASRFLVYDPRQTIYEWRGADYTQAINRTIDKYSLTESMRVPADAALVANKMADLAGCDELPLVAAKQINGADFTRMPVSVMVRSLINREIYAPGDIAVLCRTNKMVDDISRELSVDGIDCAVPISDFYGARPMLAFIARPTKHNRTRAVFELPNVDLSHAPDFLKSMSCINVSDDLLKWKTERWRDELAVRPTVGAVVRALEPYGVFTKSSADAWKDCYADWDLIEALNDQAVLGSSMPEERQSVSVMTIHKSKGLEFPAVIIPLDTSTNPSAEDYRLMYVATTRCMERVVFCSSRAGGLISESIKNVLST
jgi:hypothetical protein